MVELSKLPPEASAALAKVKSWLPKQNFNNINDFKFYSSPELVEKCKDLLGYLPKECKDIFDPESHDTRITAIHIDKSSPVPVKDGSTALLIPVAISSGAAIDGQELHELHYTRLTGGVQAKPDFFALLLLAR